MRTTVASVPSRHISVSIDRASSQPLISLDIQSPMNTIPQLPRPEGIVTNNSARTNQSLAKESPQGPCDSRQCVCYESALQRLSDLDESRSSSSSVTIDLVMSIESNVKSQTRDILNCKSCSCDRPKVLLLVGVMLENTASLLEDILDIAVRAKKSLALQHENTTSSPSLIDDHGKGNQHSNSLDSFSLRVGAYEISGEEKLTFLNHLIRLRLQSLSSAVRQLHENMLEHRQSLYCKAGTAVVVEINRRLHLANSTLENL